MNTDPIADYLTRLRNANSAGHRVVDIPFSKLKFEITKILYDQGFILSYKKQEINSSKSIKIALKYDALIIPAFAIRPKYGDFVEVFIEPSVKLTTEEDIMLKINRSLEKKILQHPHQWYWVHNRWK